MGELSVWPVTDICPSDRESISAIRSIVGMMDGARVESPLRNAEWAGKRIMIWFSFTTSSMRLLESSEDTLDLTKLTILFRATSFK